MGTWGWAVVLLAAVWVAHWGAEHLAEPLKRIRRQWGLTGAAGGSLIAIATASPEIGINVTAAFRDVSSIGLGAMLGANIIAIPIVVTVAYMAARRAAPEAEKAQSAAESSSGAEKNAGAAEGGSAAGTEGLLVETSAATVQALPYLAILAVVAVLTLPAGWRGLQPLDGWILLAAYVAYLAQAIFRGRGEGEATEWSRKGLALAAAGAIALAAGAYFTVRASENIISAIGISKLIGGLFITGTVSALPESFATWTLARSGQVTTAVTGVVGDLSATMTLAFLPLALITTPIERYPVYLVSLVFVSLMPALFAVFVHRNRGRTGFSLWQVVGLDTLYVAYVAVILVGVLKVI